MCYCVGLWTVVVMCRLCVVGTILLLYNPQQVLPLLYMYIGLPTTLCEERYCMLSPGRLAIRCVCVYCWSFRHRHWHGGGLLHCEPAIPQEQQICQHPPQGEGAGQSSSVKHVDHDHVTGPITYIISLSVRCIIVHVHE